MSSAQVACTPCVLMLVACRSPRFDRALGWLQGPVAAVARRPDDRAADLAADRGRHHPGRDRGGRARGRPARRARRIERVRRRRRMRAAELGCRGLAEHHRPGFAQRPDRGVVASGKIARVGYAAHLGRHVARLEEVLDPHRHAVDWRERPPRPPARAARIRGLPRAGLVHDHESSHRRLALGDRREAAFQVGTGRVGACEERLRGGLKARGSAVRIVGAHLCSSGQSSSGSGGRRSAQGIARSKAAATRSRRASSPTRPTSWIATGTPASSSPQGRLTAGLPVRLNGIV